MSSIRADCHATPTLYAGTDHDAEALGGCSTNVIVLVSGGCVRRTLTFAAGYRSRNSCLLSRW